MSAGSVDETSALHDAIPVASENTICDGASLTEGVESFVSQKVFHKRVEDLIRGSVSKNEIANTLLALLSVEKQNERQQNAEMFLDYLLLAGKQESKNLSIHFFCEYGEISNFLPEGMSNIGWLYLYESNVRERFMQSLNWNSIEIQKKFEAMLQIHSVVMRSMFSPEAMKEFDNLRFENSLNPMQSAKRKERAMQEITGAV